MDRCNLKYQVDLNVPHCMINHTLRDQNETHETIERLDTL